MKIQRKGLEIQTIVAFIIKLPTIFFIIRGAATGLLCVPCGVHQLGPTELFLFVSADEPFVKAPVNAVSNDVVFC